MTLRRMVVIATLLAVASSWGAARLQDDVPDAPTDESTLSPLEAIRIDLEELRFEKALSAIEAYLAEPALTEAQRVEALILRSEAHVSYGDLDAVTRDYEELLRLRPGYVPEKSLTPPKAMAKFEKVRDALVGSMLLTLEPPGARVSVDGREVAVGADGLVPALAGERTVTVERPGFDVAELPVTVEAGKTVPVRARLVPNARTVVLRTDVEGVTVTLDDVVLGETARAAGTAPGSRAWAELVVENVALGEHVFRFSKPCYQSALLQDLLTVNLTDFSPKVYEPVVLEPARALLAVWGGPEGAEVRVDGEVVGALPLDDVELCPGVRHVEVRVEDRVTWRSVETLPQSGGFTVETRPRPNAVLLGADAWPSDLGALESEVNTLDVRPLPGRADLTAPAGWRDVPLPRHTDLAVAVLPPERDGSHDRWLLFSPHLESVHRLDGADLEFGQPSWATPVTGMHLVDSRVGGPARVVRVVPGGPAAAAGIEVGDRILAVGERAVSSADEARGLWTETSTGASVVVRARTMEGETRELELTPASSPRLYRPRERSRERSAVFAAWASVAGVVGPPRDRPTALANLALALADAGRHAAAVGVWRRVKWSSADDGIGAGTAAYYMARELERLGREREAVEAFRRASGSSATGLDDDGPAVAPAAADHLVDLGVATEP